MDISTISTPKVWQTSSIKLHEMVNPSLLQLQLVVHNRFIPTGQNINHLHYTDVLWHLQQKCWEKRNGDWLAHSDNMSVHTTLSAQQSENPWRTWCKIWSLKCIILHNIFSQPLRTASYTDNTVYKQGNTPYFTVVRPEISSCSHHCSFTDNWYRVIFED
jgi:hypothetical protein